MKQVLYGDAEHEPQPEQHQQLTAEVINCSLISRLITNLQYFEFEVIHLEYTFQIFHLNY